MALPGKIFYRLPEVAERWNKEEDELLQWGASNLLEFSVAYSGGPLLPLNDQIHAAHKRNEPILTTNAPIASRGYLPLPGKSIFTILHEGEVIPVFADKEGSFVVGAKSVILKDNVQGYRLIDHPKFTAEDLVIIAEEVTRMEVDHPELLADKRNTPQGEAKRSRSDLHIIGGMLEFLLGEHGAVNFKSQAEIIDALVEHCPGLPGMTKRTLESRFAEARKAITATE